MTSHRRFQFLLGSLAVLWLLDETGSTPPDGASQALEFIREIDYMNLSHPRIRPICDNGLEIKLGVWRYLLKFGEHDNNATCTKLTTKDNYLPLYKLKVTDDYNQDLKLEENFVAIRREVWKCQFKDEKGTIKVFHRVVNEMMGLKSIAKVEYYDSVVEVNAKHHLSNGSTIHVLDIQYYSRNESAKKMVCDGGTCKYVKIGKMTMACQYDGILALDHSTPEADGNLILADHLSSEKPNSNDNLLLREVKYLGEGNYKYEESHHEIEGVDLTVGSSDFKAYGTENDIYGCIRDQVTSFPFSFRMSIYQRMKGGTIEARVPQVDYFDEYFIPVREEIWMCVEIVDGAVGKKRILRIVNEVITRKSVRSIKVKDTIVFVAHEENLNDPANKKDLDRYRLKEIKYMDMRTYNLLNYTGGVMLTDKYKKPKSNNQANKKEINYMLESNQIFRTFITGTGFDYIIGSRYEGNTVGDPNITVDCERRNLSEVASSYTAIELRLKIFSKLDKVHGVVYSSMKIMGGDVNKHIKYTKQQLHFCEHTSDQVTYKFWRVRNEIELIKLSREIETYDGVEIVMGPLENCLRVIETKYLHHEDYSVIKYVGGVNLTGGETNSSDVLNSTKKKEEEPIIYYPKTEYDIFNIYGSYGEAPRVTKGSPYSTEIKQVKVLDEETADSKTLKFGEFDVTPSENISQTDTATCELSCDYEISKNFIQSYFTPSEINNLKFYDKPNLIEVFFKIINQEVWICYTQEGIKFIRMINEVYFNRENNQGVNTLQYKSGELSYEMSNNDYQLKLKEVTYMLPPLGEQPQYIQYEGTIIMVPNRKVHMEKSWQSGTYPIEHGFTRKIYRPERDVNFELRTPHSEQPLYKTIYNTSGTITLELGTTWSQRVPQSSYKWSCAMVEHDARSAGGLEKISDAQLYTNVKIPGTKGNMRDAAFSNYFESVQLDIWKCSDSSGQMWYRVINHIILKPSLCGNMKEFYYRSGVTILTGEGENGECLEINEVKYYNASSSHVVRFDGGITLEYPGQQMATTKNSYPDTYLQAQAIRLKSGTGFVLGRKDNEYLLQGDEVFKTVVGGKGLIIEVGEPYTDQIIPKDQKSIYKCTTIDKPTDQQKNLMQPRATIRNVLDMEIESEIKLQVLNNIFTVDSQILLCEADGEDDIYKIENVMRPKRSIAAIYYYDGVTLRFHANDNSTLTIRNIRYITTDTPIRNVRFEGFVQYDPQAEEFGYSQEFTPREMNWVILDSEVVHAIGTDANNRGNSKSNAIRNYGSISCVEKDTGLEIGNKWTVEIATDKYSNAECYKGVGEFGLTFFGDYNDTSPVLMRGINVIKRMVYICTTNKGEDFLRVVNMLLIDTNIISKIYFNHGVSVTKLSMQNMGMDTMTVLSEVKYLKPDSLEIIKYTGRVIIASPISVTSLRLFPFPASLQEYPVELNLESEGGLAASTKYASFEKIKIYLMTNKQSTEDVESSKINCTDKVYSKIFASEIDNMKPSGASLLVGSPCRKELKSVYLKPKCVLDKWSNKGKVQPSTSVSLLVGTTQYMLDENTIYDYFILNDIQVWVCSTSSLLPYTFLRLVTELELRPYVSVHAISYFDGVDLKKEKIEGRDKITLRETKYLTTDGLDALKYEGEVLLMDTPGKVKLPTHERVSPVKSFFQCMKNFLVKWWGYIKTYIIVRFIHVE